MSARKRNQTIENQNSIDNIWKQDLRESKEHRVGYTLQTKPSEFRHVQPILEITEPLPPKKKR